MVFYQWYLSKPLSSRSVPCGLLRRPARLCLERLPAHVVAASLKAFPRSSLIGHACAERRGKILNFGKFSWCHASEWDCQLLLEQQGDPWSRRPMAIVYAAPASSDADAEDRTIPMRSS